MDVTDVELQKNGVKITSDTVEVDKDVSTQFRCKIIPSTSRPDPTVTWYIGSDVRQNSTSNTYTVTASETVHNKEIYCKAYNLQPESQAAVSVKPKLYVRGNVKRFKIFQFMRLPYLLYTGDQHHGRHLLSFNLFFCRIQDKCCLLSLLLVYF